VALEGTGTAPQPRGLRSITRVNDVTATRSLTNYDPILDLISKVWAANQTVTRMAMSPR
jgi:hypothetical protein